MGQRRTSGLMECTFHGIQYTHTFKNCEILRLRDSLESKIHNADNKAHNSSHQHMSPSRHRYPAH
jgi:hypothetical protein